MTIKFCSEVKGQLLTRCHTFRTLEIESILQLTCKHCSNNFYGAALIYMYHGCIQVPFALSFSLSVCL